MFAAVKKLEKPVEETLPDPFPLLKHYSSEVEISLKNETMTKESTRSFLSAVASAMLSYKRYPTREEYTRVAKDIILKYPFLKPSNGSPTVSNMHLFIMITMLFFKGGNCSVFD